MIIQQFNSGLGNQMFQYVFFRSLLKEHPEARIRADLTWFAWNDVHQGYELKKLFRPIIFKEMSRLFLKI